MVKKINRTNLNFGTVVHIYWVNVYAFANCVPRPEIRPEAEKKPKSNAISSKKNKARLYFVG